MDILVWIFISSVIKPPVLNVCPYHSDVNRKTISSQSITGSSLNYLTSLALYLSLSHTHSLLNKS